MLLTMLFWYNRYRKEILIMDKKIWLSKKGEKPFLLGSLKDFGTTIASVTMAVMAMDKGFTHYVVDGEAPVSFGQICEKDKINQSILHGFSGEHIRLA